MRLLTTILLLILCKGFTIKAQHVKASYDINIDGALHIASAVRKEASKTGKEATVAVLNSSGVIILICKGDNVGVHNTEASRRKAYTSVSTKKSSLEFMKLAQTDSLSKNLTTIPDLLLLGGGVPLFHKGVLVGAIGVSGAGGGMKDHQIAVNAAHESGYETEAGK